MQCTAYSMQLATCTMQHSEHHAPYSVAHTVATCIEQHCMIRQYSDAHQCSAAEGHRHNCRHILTWCSLGWAHPPRNPTSAGLRWPCICRLSGGELERQELPGVKARKLYASERPAAIGYIAQTANVQHTSVQHATCNIQREEATAVIGRTRATVGCDWAAHSALAGRQVRWLRGRLFRQAQAR